MNINIIERKLDHISAMVQQMQEFQQVALLDSDQAATFLGISLSTLYKLTSSGSLPYYKPNGKLIKFKREDLINWVEAHRISSNDELSDSKRKGGAR